MYSVAYISLFFEPQLAVLKQSFTEKYLLAYKIFYNTTSHIVTQPHYPKIIPNEMILCLLKSNSCVIKKRFNSILSNPTVINKWEISMITPVHKKGPKTDPNNYRGISLMSCFVKYFLAILNQRLLKFTIENKILSKSQLGFLPGNRTSDALLILHNLIDYYCHKNKKIYIWMFYRL